MKKALDTKKKRSILIKFLQFKVEDTETAIKLTQELLNTDYEDNSK